MSGIFEYGTNTLSVLLEQLRSQDTGIASAVIFAVTAVCC